MITKNCKICNKEFQCNKARELTAQFCSPEHRYEWQRLHGQRKLSKEESQKIYPHKYVNPVTIKCVGCGKEFSVTVQKNKRKYCSRECAGQYIGQLPTNAWNKGLDPNDPRVVAKCQKQSETLKERYASGKINPPWNKGLTKHTSEKVAKSVEKLTIMRNQEGEWKENWREAMRKGQVKAHAEGKYGHTFTKPEQAVWEFLTSRNFVVKKYTDKLETDDINTWYHQYPFMETFVSDFACPGLNRIIEVNGCFIHGHPIEKCKFNKQPEQLIYSERNQKRDRKKWHFYKRHGWKCVVLWECEINHGDFSRFDKYFVNL